MDQVHKRFSDEQVAFLLQAYSQGLMTRVEVQGVLGIGKSRFFSLWREYHCNPEAFTVRYRRPSSMRISPEANLLPVDSSHTSIRGLLIAFDLSLKAQEEFAHEAVAFFGHLLGGGGE